MSDGGSEDALVVFRERAVEPARPQRVSSLLASLLKTRSERTREAYARDYESFREFVGVDSVDEALIRLVGSPGPLALEIVLAFQGHLAERGLAPATINRRMAAIKAVMKLARDAQITTTQISVEHLDPEADARDVRGPGMKAIREMIAVCDADTSPAGIRDGTILRWLVLIGLRRNELRRLLMRHVVLEGDEGGIYVAQKRKRKLHRIPLSRRVLSTADRWVELRGASRGAFFHSLDRSRAKDRTMLNPTALNRIVRDRAIEAGFEDGCLSDGRSITPHGFRHTAITEVIRKYGLAAAQAFARHADPSTTQRYNDEKHLMALEAQAFMLTEL